jgi:hypothetical protein
VREPSAAKVGVRATGAAAAGVAVAAAAGVAVAVVQAAVAAAAEDSLEALVARPFSWMREAKS